MVSGSITCWKTRRALAQVMSCTVQSLTVRRRVHPRQCIPSVQLLMLRQLAEELCDLKWRTMPRLACCQGLGCQSLLRAVTAKWSGGLPLPSHVNTCW